MDSQVDLYEVLNVKTGADEAEIEAAIKRLRIKFHPDKIGHLPPDARPEAEAKWENVLEAGRVLGNRRLRGAYDRARMEQRGRGNNPGKGEQQDPAAGYYEARGEKMDREFAFEQIKRARTVQEAQQIINAYNKQFKPKNLYDAVVMLPQFETTLDGRDYEIVSVSGQRLELWKLKEFKVGDKVKVQRSSGEIDDGWTVESVSDITGKNGETGKQATVTKKMGGNKYNKTIPFRDLRKQNGRL